MPFRQIQRLYDSHGNREQFDDKRNELKRIISAMGILLAVFSKSASCIPN